MEHFAIGAVSFVFAALFPVIYFLGFQFRRLGAWSKREEKPKDRIGFFLLLALILGFSIGCFAQPQWDKVKECRALGQAVISCMLLPK